MVEVLENLSDWQAHFEANWLKHYQDTGETNFKVYEYSRNEEGVSGEAIDLTKSRLVFITTSGAYLPDSQEAYDAESSLGDYSTRIFSVDTPFKEIAFAHTHYDHKYVDEDPQVLVPLTHLKDMVNEGKIGELAPSVIAFSGYMPNAAKIVNELAPQVVGMAKALQADAALLVPA